MTAKDLKNALLQEAVQGKLVPQIASEGNARDLLNEIKCQKAKLIADGKIKKEKPLPEITDDEIPFDIPENWCWCRFGDLCTIFGRIGFRGYTTNDLVSEGNGAITLSPSNMTEFGMNYAKCTYISWFKYEESPEIKIENEDILVVKTGSSYGKTCLVKNLPEKATINPQIIVLKYVLISKEYLTYVLCSPYAKSFFEELVKGTSIPTYSQASLAKVLIPLPPLAEQKRIVAAIERFMPLIEEYGKKEEDLRQLNASIGEQAKKALLQEAVQGKLVPQDAKEGSATDLLKQIQAEKAKLIKDGKLKKEKPLPPITDDEIPFDIPENWCWCRLGEVITFINGRAYSKEELLNTGKYKVLRVGNFFTNDSWYYSNLELEPEKYCNKGDLLYAWSASFGPKIWDEDNTIFHYHIWKLDYSPKLFDKKFLLYFLQYDVNTIKNYTTGSTMIHISMTNMIPRLIPIPPLTEQKRIVRALETLLPLCEKLGR
ncbi:MAG: restriction endonuclease subunit S [Bacteroidales bacterium]|nr:restriction endonuclease subunit S [Bacteroidales bacterium]